MKRPKISKKIDKAKAASSAAHRRETAQPARKQLAEADPFANLESSEDGAPPPPFFPSPFLSIDNDIDFHCHIIIAHPVGVTASSCYTCQTFVVTLVARQATHACGCSHALPSFRLLQQK